MADWLQIRRESMCPIVVEKYGPVCVSAIKAITGMPMHHIEHHLNDLAQQHRVSSYLGYNERSCEDGATLWVIRDPAPRVGWCSGTLSLFCGDEAPSVMDEDDAFSSNDAVLA